MTGEPQGDKPPKQSDLGQFVGDQDPRGVQFGRRPKVGVTIVPNRPAMTEETKTFIRKTQMDIEKTLGITWINEPEAKEEALTAQRTLWAAGMRILDKNSSASVITKDDDLWRVLSPKDIADPLAPADAEMAIDNFAAETEKLNGETVEYRKYSSRYLTPRGVVLIEQNIGTKIMPGKQEPRPTPSPSIVKRELDADEINRLIVGLRERQSIEYDDGTHKPNPAPHDYNNVREFIGISRARRALERKPNE